MTYQVLIEARAAKQLEKLPKPVVERIDNAIVSLSANPRPFSSKMLRGRFKEGWRLRIGDYRVLYRIDDQSHEVSILKVGHRREIYR